MQHAFHSFECNSTSGCRIASQELQAYGQYSTMHDDHVYMRHEQKKKHSRSHDCSH